LTHVHGLPNSTTAAGLSALLIGGLALSLWLRDVRPTVVSPPCEEAARVDAVWNEETQHAIEAAFEATPHRFQKTSRQTVSRLLEAHAQAWALARDQTCTLASQRPAEAKRRAECLDEALNGLERWLGVLRTASPTTVEHAVEGVLALPPLAACAWRRPWPEHEVTPALDELAARVAFGASAAAQTELGAILERKDLPGRLIARAHALRGNAELAAPNAGERDAQSSDDGSSARRQAPEASPPSTASAFESSLWLAIEHRDVDLALRSGLALAELSATADSPHAAQRWWRLSSAWVTSLDRPPVYERRLLQTQARVLAAASAWRTATTLLAESLALGERLDGAFHPSLLTDLELAARTAARDGQSATSHALHRQAVAMLEQLLGPSHPRWVRAHTEFANAWLARGDDEGRDAAIAVLTTALQAGERAPFSTADAVTLAKLATLRGDHALAQRAYAEAARLVPETPLDTWLSVQLGFGGAALAAGDGAAAIPPLVAASEQLRAHQRPSDEQLATLLALAQAQQLAGAEASTQTTLEEALSLATQTFGDAAAPTLQTKVALAEALLTTAPQRAESLTREVLGADPSSTLAWATQGSAQLGQGRPEQAVRAFTRAEALAQARTPQDPAELGTIRLALASAAWEAGLRERAVAVVDALEATVGEHGPTADDLRRWRVHRGLVESTVAATSTPAP